jgi:AcrR family transcriptional regulator
MKMVKPAPDDRDGRVLRGEQNRRAILDAIHALVARGVLRPTAEQVALEAGVGTRTVFRHFADMERLHTELSERLQAEVAPLLDAAPPTGSVERRARELVERRATLYERIANFKRSGNLLQLDSAVIQREQARMPRRERENLLAALPELAQAPESLREAADLVTSFEAWDRLRTHQRLGRERAEAAMAQALRALLSSL